MSVSGAGAETGWRSWAEKHRIQKSEMNSQKLTFMIQYTMTLDQYLAQIVTHYFEPITYFTNIPDLKHKFKLSNTFSIISTHTPTHPQRHFHPDLKSSVKLVRLVHTFNPLLSVNLCSTFLMKSLQFTVQVNYSVVVCSLKVWLNSVSGSWDIFVKKETHHHSVCSE